MNQTYHALPPPPPHHSQDMAQQIPGGYAPAPAAALHAYQQHPHQLQHHQPQPHQHQHQHQPPTPSAQHQLPHPHQTLPHGHQHPPPPPQLQHQPEGPRPDEGSHEGSIHNAELFKPMSVVDKATNRRYALDVVQQPRRARMCGFGDKDRRPVTPPPCIRLVVTDATTGKEIDCNDIDHAMFVLNVDLWTESGQREVNLVRSSQGTPSISSTTPFSYSTLNGGDSSALSYGQPVLPSSRDPVYSQGSYVQDYQVPPTYNQVSPSYTSNGSYGPPQQYFPQHQGYRNNQEIAPLPSQANIAPYPRNDGASSYGQDQASSARMAMVGGQPQGMFTRNLIGSLAASAFRLNDTADRIGIWFVLQDLSVRTEGAFRLRFTFVNVGPQSGAPQDDNAPKVNQGRAPILAMAYSDIFTVYSAKKFPGVCESTPLSKSFATQGIKIPIRKDAHKPGEDDDDYGD